MLSKDQRGFGAIEAILIVVVVGIIGGAGWYVWKSQNETQDTLGNLSSAQNDPQKAEKKTEPVVDPTKDWVVFKSDKGKYSLKYPATWVIAENLNLCNEGLVLLGSSKGFVGICASEKGGQIKVFSVDGEYNGSFGQGYVDIKNEKVTIGGVNATKTTATAKGQVGTFEFNALPDGAKVVRYAATKNGKTIVAEYFELPGAPDVLKDFDLMVTKTLQFN